MFKKIVALLIMVSFFYFVGATGVLASNNISVTVKTYAGNSTPAVSTPFANQARGNQVSITHGNANANGFAFFAVNDTIRPDLSIDHQFKVLSRMSISVIYDVRDNGNVTEHAVVFVDSNRKIIEVQYVAVGQLAVTPSSLPTPPPNMNWKETPWLTADNKSLADVVDSNRIYYAQYELAVTVSSYQLTVVGGTGSGSYAYNSVATITPNAAPEGKVFSHWADAEGNKLSYKSSYKVSILAATSIQAVFVDGATSPAEQPVVSMSDDLGIKGSQFVTYKGQMQLPAGYTIVEYGFIFSRSSDVLTLSSLGATIVPSNIHYGLTGEFMRSFPADTFNSIRAYMIVQNGSNSEEVVYSDYYYRSISQIGESGTVSNDFESIANGGYESKTIYTGDISWTVTDSFTGTDANDRKNGLKSLRIRNGSLTSNSTFSNISSISFSAGAYGTDSNLSIKISVKSSSVDWVDVTDAIVDSNLSTLLKSFIVNLGDSTNFANSALSLGDDLFIKIEKGSGTATARYNIDDLSITSSAYTGPIHEVIYINDGQTITNVKQGSIISNPESKIGYTFDSWYLDSNFETPYSNTGITQSITLYAKYNINQYTINFNYNGADGGNSITSLSEDYQSIIDLPIPTKTGYTFVHWESSTGVTIYNSPFTVGNTTYNMYAKWQVNQYDIEFVTGDPEVSVPPITADYQSSVLAPSNPIREGFTFIGWYYEESFDTLVVFPLTMPLEGLTLFADWEELSGDVYTVTFDSNGGSSVSSVQVNSGSTVQQPVTPTKAGYDFVKWTLNSLDYVFSSPVVSDITLVAVWQLRTTIISTGNFTGKSSLPVGWIGVSLGSDYSSHPKIKLDSGLSSLTSPEFSLANSAEVSIIVKSNVGSGSPTTTVLVYDQDDILIATISGISTTTSTKTFTISSNVTQLKFMINKLNGNIGLGSVTIIQNP